METRLHLDIFQQPDDFTCGATCLHAVYRYYDDPIELEQVISETVHLQDGGTLAALLGCHALSRGYRATLFTYNLLAFDPIWFAPGGPSLRDRLRAQAEIKDTPKLHVATEAYVNFLDRGGRIRMKDLTVKLIRRYLGRSMPILAGLSATYLYRCPREHGPNMEYDDVRGDPTGHFVVLCGYDPKARMVRVADPHFPNPAFHSHEYAVSVDRLICAILLGIVTYDANLLIIQPPKELQGAGRADSDRRQQSQ